MTAKQIARQSWNDAELSELAVMLAKGMRHRVIAAHIGRTQDSVEYGARLLRRRGDRKPTPLVASRCQRPCLRCRRRFLSDGIHNRLCYECNKWAEDNQHQFGLPSVTLTANNPPFVRSKGVVQ